MDWYEKACEQGFENDPEYLEKIELDEEEVKHMTSPGKRVPKRRDCAWVRKRRYKKKMVRRFLSINPGLDYSALRGDSCSSAIYINYFYCEAGEYSDPNVTYSFNPYTHVFLSRRGDLRVYHGAVNSVRRSYTLMPKDQLAARLTNRRLRHHPIDEDAANRYSYCKKIYSWADDGW